jgi:putative ABC transport system ATP-binding protein
MMAVVPNALIQDAAGTPLAVSLRGVDKSYGAGSLATQVLFDINLDIPAGEIALIVGPSGCGKTTLISLMVAILDADHGELQVLGHPLHRMNDAQKTAFRKDNVGFIFQQYNLIPTLTVVENVAVPLAIAGIPNREALRRSREALARVDLTPHIDKLPKDLSGGQQQRVAIARAIVHDPKFIICDEPTAALDGRTGQMIMDLLKQVASEPGRLVVVVTHDPRIFHYGDRLVEMEDGRIIRVQVGRLDPQTVGMGLHH